MCEVPVLIETRARGREEHRLADLGVRARPLDGVLHVVHRDDRHRAAQGFGDALGGFADGDHGARLLAGTDDESLHRSFKVERLKSAKRMAMIQKRTTTFVSRQPDSSKWWCSGDILKTRRPVSLNEATWMITEAASSTKRPPTKISSTSCLMITAMQPIAPPRASDPTSPMKISAGWALNHRKPSEAPTIAPQKTASSPACGTQAMRR